MLQNQNQSAPGMPKGGKVNQSDIYKVYLNYAPNGGTGPNGQPI